MEVTLGFINLVYFSLMIVIFDIVIVLLLGLAAWRGWRNGFIMEIFYTLFIFVSIYLSIHLSNWVAEKWGGLLQMPRD